nr:MAG TPA: hypothetical protein [Caudoviricetes sp.]DAT69734.1 MAG TPA: hypothetical protein [Caudoviricetes sp.]
MQIRSSQKSTQILAEISDMIRVILVLVKQVRQMVVEKR